MSILSAKSIAASLAARYPRAGGQPGVIDSIEAGAAKPKSGVADSIQAMAIKTFSTPSKLQWVKASSLFFVCGELVQPGDYVEVSDQDAARLIRNQQAVAADQTEVDAAALGSKTKVSK